MEEKKPHTWVIEIRCKSRNPRKYQVLGGDHRTEARTAVPLTRVAVVTGEENVLRLTLRFFCDLKHTALEGGAKESRKQEENLLDLPSEGRTRGVPVYRRHLPGGEWRGRTGGGETLSGVQHNAHQTELEWAPNAKESLPLSDRK